MPEAKGSTVPRRQLGRRLKELREAARISSRAAWQDLEISETTLWRIETGKSPLRRRDVEAMCDLYAAPPETKQALVALAAESKSVGWWHSFGDVIPSSFDVYLGMEEAAAEMDTYEAELVPGLLQTEDYARALIRLHNPDSASSEVDRRVTVRVERQSLLTRVAQPPPVLQVALNESVLHRPVGSSTIMARQLAHLVYVSQLPNVTIRVVPFAAGLHPGALTMPFVLLRFPRNGDGRESEPPTVYKDGFTGSLYLDKVHEIASYSSAFAGIWQAANNDQDSAALISEIAGRHERA